MWGGGQWLVGQGLVGQGGWWRAYSGVVGWVCGDARLCSGGVAAVLLCVSPTASQPHRQAVCGTGEMAAAPSPDLRSKTTCACLVGLLTSLCCPAVAPVCLCAVLCAVPGNALIMQATRVGADTVLSQIVRLVERAQLSKAPIQAYADWVASIFVPVVVGLAFTTWATW